MKTSFLSSIPVYWRQTCAPFDRSCNLRSWKVFFLVRSWARRMRGRALVDDSEPVRGPWSRASASTGLTGKRCYPALEAQGVPQGHECGSFCRRRSIVPAGARAKSFFSRIELAEAPNSLAVYYCIDKHAYVFVSREPCGRRFSLRRSIEIKVETNEEGQEGLRRSSLYVRYSVNDVSEWVSGGIFFPWTFLTRNPCRPWSIETGVPSLSACLVFGYYRGVVRVFVRERKGWYIISCD